MAQRIQTYKTLQQKCDQTLKEQEDRALEQEKLLNQMQTKQRTKVI